jgi:hypothetical protein
MQATKPVVQRAIDDCKECHLICVQTIQYSVQQGGPHVAPDHLALRGLRPALPAQRRFHAAEFPHQRNHLHCVR